jgi:hypothetical protein
VSGNARLGSWAMVSDYSRLQSLGSLDVPMHLPVDSTGLKIYGGGEKLDHKHAVRPRRRWRKLDLCVDVHSHEIVAV